MCLCALCFCACKGCAGELVQELFVVCFGAALLYIGGCGNRRGARCLIQKILTKKNGGQKILSSIQKSFQLFVDNFLHSLNKPLTQGLLISIVAVVNNRRVTINIWCVVKPIFCQLFHTRGIVGFFYNKKRS